MSSLPKISIVTPSYNQAQFLEQTIDSVLSQQYPNLEYIIIDGGSMDNSVAIIKKYNKHLKFWVSEKDSGQANAINKGLTHCTGELFNWLNSDDYLERDSLYKIAEAFSENVDMVAGRVRNFSQNNDEIIQNQKLSSEGLMCWQKDVKFVQPGVWMKRKLLHSCGGIDDQFHYAFDWDLYIRYLYHYSNVKEIPDTLVHFRQHEQSKTESMKNRFAVEERLIIEKLSSLPEYKNLHNYCKLKMDMAGWTTFLSKQSTSNTSFFNKALSTISAMWKYKSVSVSRQTAGALKAFWKGKEI